jgi:hypothetical protein
MGDTNPRISDCHPKKRAKHLGRLHPYWGGPNSQDDNSENRESSPKITSHPDDDEKSVTISTQGRRSMLGSESCQSISNSSNQNQLPPLNAKSLEIQELVHTFATLLNDSIRIAETAYSVCLLETQISVLIQAQKIAKVRTFLMMLI